MESYKKEFIEFMVDSEVLKFGEFTVNKNKANASISICLTVHCYFIGIAGCGVTVYIMVVSGSSP